MGKSLYLLRLLLLVAGFYALQAQAEAPKLRIISLSPHLTEMIFSAGAGQDLVGVDSYSNYPSEVTHLPKVGDAFHLNFERILSLKPDLVLVWQASIKPHDLQRLQDLGLRIFVSNIQTLNDIPNEIEQIGNLAGTQQHAFAVSQSLRHHLTSLKKKYAYSKPISVFYEVWNQPYTTINGQQFISQGLSLCGAKNVFADAKPLAPQVNLETILMKNPQIILLGSTTNNQIQWWKDWYRYPTLSAVKYKQVSGVNSDLYQRPTERFIEALPDLCKVIDNARMAYGWH